MPTGSFFFQAFVKLVIGLSFQAAAASAHPRSTFLCLKQQVPGAALNSNIYYQFTMTLLFIQVSFRDKYLLIFDKNILTINVQNGILRKKKAGCCALADSNEGGD